MPAVDFEKLFPSLYQANTQPKLQKPSTAARKALEAPAGYAFTGEFRTPKGEWFLDTTNGQALWAAMLDGSPAYPILREQYVDAWRTYAAPAYKQEPPMPTPPPGWKITGRGPIAAGAYFMQSEDRRIWRNDSPNLYKNGLFAWKVAPELELPSKLPTFKSKNAFRVPLVGEWFLAKGDGPQAGKNDPVKLGKYDPVPTGARWILEIVK